LKNLNINFNEFKEENRKLITRVDCVEDKQIAVGEKLSNLAIFQGFLSIILSGIAGYLGIKK
jgi:hypothetical protein